MRSGKNDMLHEIDKKRLALLSMKRKQLAERAQRDDNVERMIAEVQARVAAYETARQPPSAAELRSLAQDEMKKAGIMKLGIKRGDGQVQKLGDGEATAAG